MNKNQNKTLIRNLTLNGIMLALIVAMQAVNLPNIVTGIIVNAILVFVSLYSGIKSAIILCLLSPFCGLLTGHVPIVMYPVLPMIAMGNTLLVAVLVKIDKKPMLLKIFIPAFIKATIIGFGGLALIHLFLPDKLANFLLFSVLGIQFFTAVPGIFLGIKLSDTCKKSLNSH